MDGGSEISGALRSSLLRRLGAGAASLPADIRGDVSPEIATSAFLDGVAAEVRAIEARLDPIWRARVDGASEPRPSLNVHCRDMRLSVRIAPKAEEPPSIEFAVGAALAFDDLALLALCNDLFLAPDLAALGVLVRDDGAYGAQGVVGAQLETPLRYRDYAALLEHEVLDRDILTYALPSAPWRLLQASMLSELMLAFALLHERSHFALAHLDALSADACFGLSDGAQSLEAHPGGAPQNGGGGLSSDERRVIEIQADMQAFFILCAYALSPDGAYARYAAALGKTGAPATALSALALEEGIRVCLTAASLACLAFHLGANPDPSRRNPHYPSPHARLMNLMVSAPILSPLVNRIEDRFVLKSADCEDEHGGHAPAFQRLVENVFGMALTDLRVASAYFGEALSPLRRGNGAGDVEVAEWVDDLSAFWISNVEGLNRRPVTEAAKELQALRPVEAALAARLGKLQADRFGMATGVDVADLIGEDSIEDGAATAPGPPL